jgi:tRNA pseudouridine55 synthase
VTGPDGALVVDKPSGPTSHDVVDRVRKALGTRRVGHTGTLDPFASGVLPICLGKATRLARFLSQGDKSYRATLLLGFATRTDDLTGEPLGAPSEVQVTPEALDEACRRLRGPIRQVPPAYSAKRIGGRRAYELARAGVEVERAAVPVVVHRLQVLALEGSRVELDVRCSAGTYIRALARDLGALLGVGGHLTALRRTECAGFGLEDALAWDEIAASAPARVVPPGRLLTHMPAARVRPEGLAALRHGRDLDAQLVAEGFPSAPPPERMRLLDQEGALLALAVPRGFETRTPGLPVVPVLHPDVVLIGES